MIEISKELLGEVLKISIEKLRYNELTKCYEVFKHTAFNWSNGEYGRWGNLDINIYELAFNNLKQWALSKEIDIVSGEQFAAFLIKGKQNTFNADTEVEAIIKACEWILKEIKK